MDANLAKCTLGKLAVVTWVLALIALLTACGGGGSDGGGSDCSQTPCNLTASAGPGSATLTWSPLVDTSDGWNVDWYNLYLASSSDVTSQNYQMRPDGRGLSRVTSPFIVKCLEPSKTYYFTVTARVTVWVEDIPFGTGETADSNRASVTPLPLQGPGPSAPSGLEAIPGPGAVTLRWAAAPEGEDVLSYTLHQASTPWSTWSEQLPDARRYTGLKGTSHTIGGLEPGRSYWFSVASMCGAESPQSSQVAAAPVQAGSWAWPTGVTTDRRYAGGAVIDDRLYVVGGVGVGGVPTLLEVYDPASDTWVTKQPMPTARHSLAVAASGGLLYAIGGSSSGSGEDLSTVEVYDPATDTWSSRASMPTARSGLAVGVVDGILYLVGGSRESVEQGTVVAYDPSTDRWSTRDPMPTARSGLAVSVVDGILYAIGGFSRDGTWLGTVEAFDPRTGTWTTKASMPTARFDFAAATIESAIYAVGGYGTRYFDGQLIPAGKTTLEVYQPLTNSWMRQPDKTVGEIGPVAGAIDGKLYVSGLALEVFTPPR